MRRPMGASAGVGERAPTHHPTDGEVINTQTKMQLE
jgi:hypothetical protein